MSIGVRHFRHPARKRRRPEECPEDDIDAAEDFEDDITAMSISTPHVSFRPVTEVGYGVARHSDPGGCTVPNCSKFSHKGQCSSSASGSEFNNQGLTCPPKLFFPVTPQVRYVSERIVEVFTANAKGTVELHHILHPNMPRHTRYTVESVNLSDGLPCHRVTTRDVVDRAPFSVYGTFHGIIGIAKSTCAPDLNRIDVNEIWRGENPVMAIRVNQMDNGLLAATDFHCISARSSLFVLDLVSQSRISLEPRQVLRTSTYCNMLDVCWLWDHPSRMVLSTTDGLRLFDIRCPRRTDQALFLDRGVTHMASNKYRTHVFAGFNDDEVHIYDSRQLFGPVQQIKVSHNGCNGLNSLRWNPYMPYELLLHFRDSPRILRCNAQDLSFDIFRRRVLDSFTPEDLFTMEQVWDAGLPPDVVSERRKTYAAVDDVYPLLSYGEMYDKCKENPEISMPLCWTTPVPERSCHDEELVVHFVDTDLGTATPTSMMLRRSYSDSNLHRKFPGFNLHVAPPSLVRVKGLFEEASSPPTKVPFEELESSLTKNLLSTNDNVLEENGLINRAGSIAKMLRKSSSSSILETLMDGNSVDSDQMSTAESNSTLPITRRSISYTENVHVATENDDPSEEVGIEGTFERICSSHAENLSSIFNQLGLDFKDQKAMAELRDEIEAAMRYDSKQGFPLSYVVRNFDVHDSVTRSNVDDGHRIKLQHKVFSFDFAPVGYSGILCLENMENGSMKLVFVPFMAADEGFSVRPEYVKVLREIRMWEAFDSIPYHLYQTMKLRLCNGMDRIGDEKTLIPMFVGLAENIRKPWMQWLLCSARQQVSYQETAETSDLEDGATDGDEQSSIEKTPVSSDVCNIRPNIIAKGIPGILQLCTLEEDRDVVWQSCDSIHFTFLKIARSPIRKMILSPYCLPVTEDRVVSDERFAACTDILKQIPVIFLCFISGDTVRFIEYTLFLRQKLGKPVYTDNPCSFLNAFYFFSSVVSKYVNRISGAVNKSSPSYFARRLRLVDKIENFVKGNSKSPSLNPLFIPMLLLIHGELTCTHPETFTKAVLDSKAVPLCLRIAWCVNLLSSARMKEAFRYLFQQSSGMDRLQFVGFGRHPDALQVLSEFLYTTQDCQVFSHLLVAGRCFEEESSLSDESIGGSDDNLKSDIDDESVKEQSSVNAPSLFTVFPTSYLDAAGVMPDLLHLAKAEFCRYSFILQRLERYCFRRKLLNLVPQIYWPDFKTSVDISCTFCGSSYEVALRNAEQAASEQLSQVRSRPTVTRTAASRSSVSVGSTMTSMSLSLTSTAPSDSDINVNTVTSSAMTPTSESYYDYNGVDGGTEAEIKRPPDSACPQCRKSYPRCCLCGLSYGTPVNDYDHPSGTFSMMFSTCLMCSHGGHTKHVISWFEKEEECPVLGCDCRCLHLENEISGRIRENFMTPY